MAAAARLEGVRGGVVRDWPPVVAGEEPGESDRAGCRGAGAPGLIGGVEWWFAGR